MCSGSEAGSYSRLIDFVFHSTLGLRVIQKGKKKVQESGLNLPGELFSRQVESQFPYRSGNFWREVAVMATINTPLVRELQKLELVSGCLPASRLKPSTGV